MSHVLLFIHQLYYLVMPGGLHRQVALQIRQHGLPMHSDRSLHHLKIAETEYEIASLEFQQKLIDAGTEVNDAITSWQTAKERLILDKKQIVALQGAVHNTRLLMRNSNTNYLEVLTAQQRLLEAELTEATDNYNAIQSIITLYHALGGGTE